MAIWPDEIIELSDLWPHNELQRAEILENFTAFREKVANRLGESSWACGYDFPQAIRRTASVDEFNDEMNNIYDQADIDRVWINTF